MARLKHIVDSLQLAIGRLWDGRLEFVAEEDHTKPMGEMVFCEGRIAWAQDANPMRTLGATLWRLGHVTRHQLTTVQRLYDAAAGKKRLGRVLEEAELISRPILKRDLLMHTRSITRHLLDTEGLVAIMHDGPFAADEPILFAAEDVLPEGWSESPEEFMVEETTEARSWAQRTSENRILHPFSDLPGYRASGIVSRQGDLDCAHNRADIDLKQQAVSIAAMFEASTRTLGGTPLSTLEFATLDCAEGALAVRWIDPARTHFIFVIQASHHNPSLTRYALKLALDDLLQWLERRHGVDGAEAGAESTTNSPWEPPIFD